MPGLREVVGTRLIGTRGKTEADQENIDSTVARLCGGNVYRADECQRHGEALATTPPSS